MEILAWIFFAIRLYTVLITVGAGVVIWLYAHLVKNPDFANFVRKFWALLFMLGAQGLWAITHAHFPLTDDNMIFVVIMAAIKSWIFFGYLPMYLSQKKKQLTPYDSLDIDEQVKRSLNILDYK